MNLFAQARLEFGNGHKFQTIFILTGFKLAAMFPVVPDCFATSFDLTTLFGLTKLLPKGLSTNGTESYARCPPER